MKNRGLINFLSYIALVIIAVLIVLGNFLPIVGINVTGTLVNILNTVRNVLILLVIGVAAYNYLPGKPNWIRILFWVSIIVFIVGTVLIWFVK